MPHGASRWIAPLAVSLVTLGSYVTTFFMDWVNWDDPLNFLSNRNYRGFTWDNLRWMFTTNHAGHYIPLTWITLAWDYELWGMDARGYHVMNVFFHTLAAVAMYAVILELLKKALPAESVPGRWRTAAAVGALVFAVHPLRVESVAWITERRDSVSGLFVLLTVWVYLRAPGEGRERIRALAVATGLYFAALLSKATVMPLPGVLMVLDAYPLKRWTPSTTRIVVLEKLPMIVLTAIFAVITLEAQKHSGSLYDTYPLLDSVMQPGYRIFFYVSRTLLPIDLSPLYPMEYVQSIAQARYLLPTIGVMVLTGVLVRQRRRWPAVLAAWLCFGGLLMPMIGINHAGPQQVADRYSYLACMPWAVLAAGAVFVFWSRAALAASVILVATLGVLTTIQCGVWRNSIALWTRAIEMNPRTWLAFNNRAQIREMTGDVEGAIQDYLETIRIDPAYVQAHYNLCVTLERKGDLQAAMDGYRRVTRLNPRFPNEFIDRGMAHAKLGNLEAALQDFDEAVRRAPRNDNAWYNRGNARLERGDVDGAIADFNEAIRINPGSAAAWVNRAKGRIQKKDWIGAVEDCTRSIHLDPDNEPSYRNRGSARANLGDLDGALQDFTEAVRLDPKSPANYVNRGFARLVKGQFDGAIEDLSEALRLDPANPIPLAHRAMARARKGEWKESIADYTDLIQREPQVPGHYVRRGSARANHGDLDGALADLTQALSMDSKNIETYVVRARVRAEKKDREGALADLRRALELTPEEGPVRTRIQEEIRKIEKP